MVCLSHILGLARENGQGAVVRKCTSHEPGSIRAVAPNGSYKLFKHSCYCRHCAGLCRSGKMNMYDQYLNAISSVVSSDQAAASLHFADERPKTTQKKSGAGHLQHSKNFAN